MASLSAVAAVLKQKPCGAFVASFSFSVAPMVFGVFVFSPHGGTLI